MGKKVAGKVYWVGKVDWELRNFHGDEYSTHRGSSYNSYLIREKKTVVLDTLWKPSAKDIDLSTIDYVVAHHAEVDHSGALPELMARIPGTPIYRSENGVKSLRGHYRQDWNFKPV